MFGVGLATWERDMSALSYTLANSRDGWVECAVDHLREYYALDYRECLSDTVNLADLRVIEITSVNDKPGWKKYVVSWTASLNAYDHQVGMIYYDFIAVSPSDEILIRHYEIHSDERML